MARNIIPESGIPEPSIPNEGRDVLGSNKLEKENLLKKKVEMKEKYASMRDEIKEEIFYQEDSPETFIAPKVNNNNSLHPNKQEKEFSAFTSIPTRRDSDFGKGLIHAVRDSAVIFGGVIWNLGKDIPQVARHPINITQDTIAYLEKESSAKII